MVTWAIGACRSRLPDPPRVDEASGETPSRGGTLHLASFGNIRELDPATAADALSNQIVHLVFAGLVDFAQDGTISADLAERFAIENGGRTYRFWLREGVRFHDGSTLGANDVKRTVERALAPTTPNPMAAFFSVIRGFDAFQKGAAHLEGVRVDGPLVVSIELDHPDAAFLPLFATSSLRPVCPTGGDRVDPDFLPCGAGPFKLEPGGWQRGRSVTVTRHEHYFRAGLPYLDAVHFDFGMSVFAQRLRFERGELDIARELSHADALRYLEDPRWKSFGSFEPSRTVFGEAMNTTIAPFDNVEVRRAVAHAVNREHYRLLKAANVVTMNRVLPKAIRLRDPELEGQRYDLDKALEHMRRAGYPFNPETGEGGYPHPILYTAYQQGFSEYSAQVLKQDLARIGIRIEIRILSFATYLSLTQRRGQSALSPQGWTQDYPDPSSFLEPLFASSSIRDDGSTNAAFYSSPGVDARLAEARRMTNESKRRAVYASVERDICDAAPWAFTHGYRWFELRQPRVRGYTPHPVWPQDVRKVWLARARGGLREHAGVLGPWLERATALGGRGGAR